MSSPIYQPLRTFRKEIRILVVPGGKDTDPLEADLITVSLLQKPVYAALSYRWQVDNGDSNEGGSSRRAAVNIRGHQIGISRDLEQALRRLRMRRAELRIWIDAICIAQDDFDERGHQVALMVDVYSQAEQVHVWLGEKPVEWSEQKEDQQGEQQALQDGKDGHDPTGFQRCFDCDAARTARSRLSPANDDIYTRFSALDVAIRDALRIAACLVRDEHLVTAFGHCAVHRSGRTPHYFLTKRWCDGLRLLLDIFAQPWWERVWILQEVLLATRDPLVHLSSHRIPLSFLLECSFNLHKHVTTCCDLSPAAMYLPLPSSNPFYSDKGPAGSVETLHLRTAVDLGKLKADFSPRVLSLSRALISSRCRHATDPRDHLYGILGLVDSFSRERASPSYNKPVSDAFIKATALLVIEHRSLRHLEHAEGNLHNPAYDKIDRQGRSYDIDIPSWACDFRWDEKPRFTYHLFRACGSGPFREHWNNRILNGCDFHAYAIHIDTVAKVWPTVGCGRTAIENFQEALKDEAIFTTAPTRDIRFWRAAFHGMCGGDVREQPLRRMEAGDEADVMEWWHETFFNVVAAGTLIQPWSIKPGDTRMFLHLHNMLHRCFSFYGDHVLFLTESGRLGSRAGPVRVGDQISVLSGADAPVLLRPSTTPQRRGHGRECFSFAGLCYVDGIMDGEAVTASTAWQSVVLC